MADNSQTFPKTEAKPLLESMTIQITLFQTYKSLSQFVVLVVNYGISNTIVLEIP